MLTGLSLENPEKQKVKDVGIITKDIAYVSNSLRAAGSLNGTDD